MTANEPTGLIQRMHRKQLQQALIKGQVGDVRRLVYQTAHGWQVLLSSLLWFALPQHKVGANHKSNVDLNYVYDDDNCGSAALYLAAGKEMSRSQYLAVASQSHRISAKDRAYLIRWLLQSGFLLDFSLINSRCEGVLHCCLLNGSSPEVLHAVLSSLQGYPKELQPLLQAEDANGDVALDLAISTQQWLSAALLVHAGALKESKSLRNSKKHLQGILGEGPCRQLPTPYVEQVLDRLPFRIGYLLRDLMTGEQAVSEAEVEEVYNGLPAAIDHVDAVNGAAVSMDAEAVTEHMQSAIQHVSYVLGMGKETAMSLLIANSWDIDLAIERGVLAQDPGQPGAPVGSQPRQTAGPIGCIVCFDVKDAAEFSLRLSCGHPTCDSCWRGILHARLDEGNPHHTHCPQPGCNLAPPLDTAQLLLPEQERHRFRQLLAQRYVDSNPHIRWCTRAGCGRSLHLAARGSGAGGEAAAEALAAGRPVTVQCSCGARFCWSCLHAPHEPALCSQVDSWRALLAELARRADDESAAWITSNTRSCPQCRSRIQKSGGCNHMTCRVCDFEFCWICSRDWRQHNAATGGYYRCNMYVEQTAGSGSPSAALASGGGDRRQRRGWVSAMRDAAARHKQHCYMQHYLAHEFDGARAGALADHMAELLRAALRPAGLDHLLLHGHLPTDGEADGADKAADRDVAANARGSWLAVLRLGVGWMRWPHLWSGTGAGRAGGQGSAPAGAAGQSGRLGAAAAARLGRALAPGTQRERQEGLQQHSLQQQQGQHARQEGAANGVRHEIARPPRGSSSGGRAFLSSGGNSENSSRLVPADGVASRIGTPASAGTESAGPAGAGEVAGAGAGSPPLEAPSPRRKSLQRRRQRLASTSGGASGEGGSTSSGTDTTPIASSMPASPLVVAAQNATSTAVATSVAVSPPDRDLRSAAESSSVRLPPKSKTPGIGGPSEPLAFARRTGPVTALGDEVDSEGVEGTADAVVGGDFGSARGAVLSPPPPEFWSSWCLTLVQAKEVLANSYVLAYYLHDLTGRRYLEHLQARLAAAVEQLLAPLERLPHADKVPLPPPSASAQSAAATPSAGQATGAGPSGRSTPETRAGNRSLLAWLAAKLGLSYRVAAPPVPGSVRFNLGGQEIRDQVFYVLALNEQRERLKGKMAEVWRWQQCIVACTRSGKFGHADDGSADGGVTPIDVVSMATMNRTALWQALAVHAHHLSTAWSNWLRG